MERRENRRESTSCASKVNVHTVMLVGALADFSLSGKLSCHLCGDGTLTVKSEFIGKYIM
jgi:hypothetical protein